MIKNFVFVMIVCLLPISFIYAEENWIREYEEAYDNILNGDFQRIEHLIERDINPYNIALFKDESHENSLTNDEKLSAYKALTAYYNVRELNQDSEYVIYLSELQKAYTGVVGFDYGLLVEDFTLEEALKQVIDLDKQYPYYAEIKQAKVMLLGKLGRFDEMDSQLNEVRRYYFEALKSQNKLNPFLIDIMPLYLEWFNAKLSESEPLQAERVYTIFIDLYHQSVVEFEFKTSQVLMLNALANSFYTNGDHVKAKSYYNVLMNLLFPDDMRYGSDINCYRHNPLTHEQVILGLEQYCLILESESKWTEHKQNVLRLNDFYGHAGSDYFDEAKRYFIAGDFENAANIFASILKEHPYHLDAKVHLKLINLIAEGKTNDVADTLDKTNEIYNIFASEIKGDYVESQRLIVEELKSLYTSGFLKTVLSIMIWIYPVFLMGMVILVIKLFVSNITKKPLRYSMVTKKFYAEKESIETALHETTVTPTIVSEFEVD